MDRRHRARPAAPDGDHGPGRGRRRWTEVGRWHGIDAELTLEFTADGEGCRVTPTFRVTGRGVAAVPAYVVDKVAVLGVYPDLRRAARLLAARD